ncbi:MAG TPA: CvpA family protein, partial [Salinimicrobium sp.]|nr:CvpA family protein [Salinimicrobium sp.]
VIAIVLLGRMLTKLLNLLALGIVNRLAGAFFGLLKMAFFASLFFMFLNQSKIYSIEKESRERSILYSPVEDLAPLILPSILEEIEELKLFDTSSEESSRGK